MNDLTTYIPIHRQHFRTPECSRLPALPLASGMRDVGTSHSSQSQSYLCTGTGAGLWPCTPTPTPAPPLIMGSRGNVSCLVGHAPPPSFLLPAAHQKCWPHVQRRLCSACSNWRDRAGEEAAAAAVHLTPASDGRLVGVAKLTGPTRNLSTITWRGGDGRPALGSLACLSIVHGGWDVS